MKLWMIILLAVGAYVLISFLGRHSRIWLLRMSWLIIVLPFSLIKDVIETVRDPNGDYDEWMYERYIRKSTNDDFATYWGKKYGKYDERGEDNQTSGAYTGSRKLKAANIFHGLSKDAARKKYHELMKKFHPDNGGSSEKAERLIRDYKEYQEQGETNAAQ